MNEGNTLNGIITGDDNKKDNNTKDSIVSHLMDNYQKYVPTKSK